MALGKRKRRDQLRSPSEAENAELDDDTDLQALLQKHFEAKFEPLQYIDHKIGNRELSRSPSADESSISDWEGLSDEEKDGPEIINCDLSTVSNEELPNQEIRSFMGAQPPSALSAPSSNPPKTQSYELDPKDEASEAANLKKDLALQRLLKESHLLESASLLSVVGKNRHKALDMRLQDLGSKSSVYRQEKMPMTHRKGITAKAIQKEGIRRKEAQENGIILEKATKGKKASETRRQRPPGAPAIGKFQGAMLKLSKKDVAEVQGPRQFRKRRK